MDASAVDLQLTRIEEIQAELRRVILDGSLAGLEALSTECQMRLQTLLTPQPTPALAAETAQQRLEAILATHSQLEQLVTRLLPVIATELRKAHDSRQIAQKYAVGPAKAATSLAHCTDVVS